MEKFQYWQRGQIFFLVTSTRADWAKHPQKSSFLMVNRGMCHSICHMWSNGITFSDRLIARNLAIRFNQHQSQPPTYTSVAIWIWRNMMKSKKMAFCLSMEWKKLVILIFRYFVVHPDIILYNKMTFLNAVLYYVCASDHINNGYPREIKNAWEMRTKKSASSFCGRKEMLNEREKMENVY